MEIMETLLGTLNPAQLEAVTATEGYIRVIAGAGSGKTRALSHRFAYLVNEVGILPGNILCVTFTNKASQEMRQRIHALTGDNDTGYINTFHGFCVSILQEDSYAVEYPKSFLVLDNADIDTMLKVIYEERGLGLRDMTFAKARDMIEIQKLFKKPEYYLDMLTLPLEELKQKYQKAETLEDIIFYGYLYQERKCFGLDYNDLIKVTLFIFSRSEEIRLKWQKRLEYIMIDEFQDIDGLQYELMCVLRRGGPGSDHLHLAGSKHPLSSGLRGEFPRLSYHHDDAQLPFHRYHPQGSQQPDRQKSGEDPQISDPCPGGGGKTRLPFRLECREGGGLDCPGGNAAEGKGRHSPEKHHHTLPCPLRHQVSGGGFY